MSISLHPNRGQKIASLLYKSFSTIGIHGHTEMPEDILPVGVKHGSLEHLLLITLTISIDYQRDADLLWESSRKSFEDPQINYLFRPEQLHYVPITKIIEDMQKFGLSKKPRKDAKIWQTVGISFYKKWDGDPRNFLEDCDWFGPRILERLKLDNHKYGNAMRNDFPYLRGDKIGPLWLRMLRDNVGLSDLQGLEEVPIPVDIHIARASLALGLIQGTYSGPLNNIFDAIRSVWADSVRGLEIRNRSMIALDVDEPLWHLSRYGCTKRNKISGDCPVFSKCEANEFCITGQVDISNNIVELQVVSRILCKWVDWLVTEGTGLQSGLPVG
ncbi:hypothetical protein ACFLYP_03760 [Chloroflexota bacterium]